MRTEKSPPCTACSAASSSRRSSSDARSMARGSGARRAALPLLLGFAPTLDFDSIASLHAVKTHSSAPRRKVQTIIRWAIVRKMVTPKVGFASMGDTVACAARKSWQMGQGKSNIFGEDTTARKNYNLGARGAARAGAAPLHG